jgi:FkbM family methyltransferase
MRSKLLRNSIFLAFAHKLVFIQNFVTLKLVLAGNSSQVGKVDLIRVGSAYGGWFVPKRSRDSTRSSVVVSAGLGYDTTFDLEMIRNGNYLIGLDPLLECCEIAKANLAPHGDFEVLNCGLASRTGTQNFYAPKVSGHDSYSTINVQEVANPVAVSFPVISLRDLFTRYRKLEGAEYKILKMDIEGAELEILTSSMAEVNRFDFLAVEMDALSLIPFFSISTRLKRIFIVRKIIAELKRSAQWRIVKTENFNFFWLKLGF